MTVRTLNRSRKLKPNIHVSDKIDYEDRTSKLFVVML